MNKYRILVVDDEVDVRQIIVAALRPFFEVVEAHDGLDALEKLERSEPDFVLMDVMMPLMDGFQACDAIRKNSRFREVPVMFLSALSSKEDIRRGYTAGANLYLTKPFEPSRLVRNIQLFFETTPRRIVNKRYTILQLQQMEKQAAQARADSLAGGAPADDPLAVPSVPPSSPPMPLAAPPVAPPNPSSPGSSVPGASGVGMSTQTMAAFDLGPRTASFVPVRAPGAQSNPPGIRPATGSGTATGGLTPIQGPAHTPATAAGAANPVLPSLSAPFGGGPGVDPSPISTGSTHDQVTPSMSTDGHGSLPRVMIIDDDPTIVEIMAMTISGLFESCWAHDGLQAVERIVRFQPDIIVLDLMLPKMSGYQLCQSLRSNRTFAKTPILICSAKSTEKDIAFAKRQGASDFLPKPFEGTQLIDKLVGMARTPGFAVKPKSVPIEEILLEIKPLSASNPATNTHTFDGESDVRKVVPGATVDLQSPHSTTDRSIRNFLKEESKKEPTERPPEKKRRFLFGFGRKDE